VSAQQGRKSRLILMIDETTQELLIGHAPLIRQERGSPKVGEDTVQVVDRHGIPFLSSLDPSLSITSGSGQVSYTIFLAPSAAGPQTEENLAPGRHGPGYCG
jgi:hypothetical protein